MQAKHVIIKGETGILSCSCGLEYPTLTDLESHVATANRYGKPTELAISEAPKYVQKQVKTLGLELSMDQITRTKSIFSGNQVAKLYGRTPLKYQYSRPGKGGGKWSYVRSSYVRRVLDAVFGFYWDFDITTGVGEAFEVAKVTGVAVVKGVLVGHVKHEDKWVEVRKTQFGRQEVIFRKQTDTEIRNGSPRVPLDFGNDMKGAGTDALKKCAQQLNIASDVYDPQEFQDIKIIESSEESAQSKNLKDKIEAARSEISKESGEVQR